MSEIPDTWMPSKLLEEFAGKIRAERFPAINTHGNRTSVVADIDAMIWIQEAYQAGRDAS